VPKRGNKKKKKKVVPLPFQHKLNYFSFCEIFEKLFIIYAEILIKSKF
jgi:hypothetical protein